MAKRSWNWVVYLPSEDEEAVLVFTRRVKPVVDPLWDGSFIRICSEEFKRTFGFLPEPDKPVKVAFTGVLYTSPKKSTTTARATNKPDTLFPDTAKPARRLYTCPECETMSDGSTHRTPSGRQCDMVRGRRGWRQLGVYDG